ncbi:MAG: HAD family hydrolase [Cellulosilyticaceae bacterium]
MYKGVIFDLDGTLLDTIQDLAEATNYALTAHGYNTYDTNQYKTFVGNGVYKLIERALPKEACDEKSILKVKETFDLYYGEHSMDHTAPYIGIVALLQKLKEKGIRMGVVSNKPDLYVKALVEEVFGTWIEAAIGQREGIPHKPSPEGTYEMLEILGLAKEECIFVGDSNVDIKTSKNAGLFSVGVLWGFRTKEELEKEGANKVIESPQELLAIV